MTDLFIYEIRGIQAKAVKYILLLAITGITYDPASAQNNKTTTGHIVNVSLEISDISDTYLSLYSEKFLSTGLAYTFLTSNAFHKKQLSLSWEKGNSKSDKDPVNVNNISFQFVNGFSVLKNKNTPVNYYVGYHISANPCFIKSRELYSWTTLNSLSLYNSVVYSHNKSKISFDLVIPFAGLASRPDGSESYSGDINEMLYNSYSGLTFTSIHNLKAIDASLLYGQDLTKRLRLQAGFSFSFKELNTGYLFTERTYRINTGLSYRL